LRRRRSPTGQGGEGGHGEDDNDNDDNNEEDEDGDPVSEEYVQVKAATEPSSSSALVQLNRMKKEKVLVGIISKQIQEAGGCRMLVKVRQENSLPLSALLSYTPSLPPLPQELELYVDPSSSHYDHTPAKHTHIALKSTCWFILSCALLLSHLPSHPLSQLFSISILFLFSQLGLEPSQGTADLPTTETLCQ
jgi:hypothetical protein